jgi:hypothetical protein
MRGSLLLLPFVLCWGSRLSGLTLSIFLECTIINISVTFHFMWGALCSIFMLKHQPVSCRSNCANLWMICRLFGHERLSCVDSSLEWHHSYSATGKRVSQYLNLVSNSGCSCTQLHMIPWRTARFACAFENTFGCQGRAYILYPKLVWVWISVPAVETKAWTSCGFEALGER